jgi:hypothetical protein
MTRDPQRLWARPRQGGCRYMLLGPELSGQRCICVEYTRNKAAPASFCYCGHQADDHDIRKEENDIEEEGIGLKEPPKQETDEAKHDLTTGFGELEEHVSKCKAETELGVNATCQSIDRAGDYYAMYDLAGFDLGGDYGGISGLQWSEGPSSLPPQPINPDAITCLISIANKAMSSNTRPSCPPTALLANSHGHRKPKWPELEVELAKWYVSLHSPPKGPVVKAKAKELWQKLAPKHFAGQKQPGFRRGWRNLFKERNGLNLVKAPAEEGPTEFQPLFATDHEVPESSKSGEIDNSTHKDSKLRFEIFHSLAVLA